jgi:hypothetical protein
MSHTDKNVIANWNFVSEQKKKAGRDYNKWIQPVYVWERERSIVSQVVHEEETLLLKYEEGGNSWAEITKTNLIN